MKVLYKPLNPFYINQKFGDNKSCVSTDGTNKVISCDGTHPPNGYRSLYGTAGHLGLDLRASHGQPVYAAQDGVVYHIDTDPKSGLDVRIESLVGGRSYRHIYEHLLGYQVKKGDTVTAGQLIGWCDNTGYSSGDHLHFQVEEWNGSAWIPTDPLPLMEEMFAPDALAITNKLMFIKERVAELADRVADYLRTHNK